RQVDRTGVRDQRQQQRADADRAGGRRRRGRHDRRHRGEGRRQPGDRLGRRYRGQRLGRPPGDRRPAGSNHTAGIASAFITKPLAAGDTITVTYQGATAMTTWFGIAYDFRGIAPAPAFDVSATASGSTKTLTGGVTPA